MKEGAGLLEEIVICHQYRRLSLTMKMSEWDMWALRPKEEDENSYIHTSGSRTDIKKLIFQIMNLLVTSSGLRADV